jgi:uncharacterized membrane protein YvlD (DUF360 family)
MKQPIRHLLRILVRLLVLWAIDAVAMWITITLLPGVSVTGAAVGAIAAAAALLLAVINLFLRPIILLLALPLGFFVTFGVGFLVNAIALLLVARVLPDFQISGLLSAFIAGLVFSLINTIITGVISVDDEDSFYQGVVERLATRQTYKDKDLNTRGLVMMEIDGLSYHHIQKALKEGYMPNLQKMIDEDGYALSRVDCGLPSQTSACQAGIMFGDNFDIPSFRWYDKDEQKLFVSGKDASLLDSRYAKGNGLMRGGSSINNMLAGDAEKSILTASNFKTGSSDEKKRRAEDIYLLALNPYFLMRVIVLFLGEVILEVWQGWQQKRKKVEPRQDRLHKFYPFVRASMTVLMRDVSSYLLTLDIIRGAPSIYLTWPGYDEVAHHSGPWTTDAFKTLRQYDRVIGRIQDIIERKAPRPYDLLILSDHGQSFGATFLMRYGYSLKEFVEKNLPEGTQATVGQTSGGDDGTLQLASMAGELQNVQEQGVGGSTGKAIMKQAGKYADRATTAQLAAGELTAPVSITVCGSGNLGQIYFDLYPRKIKQNELDAAYPGLINALVKHEGIGVVVVADEAGVPIALGKNGQRNLHTNQVTGSDPLKMYGDPDLRAGQVRRVADFPHVGDIMILSTVYADGTVAAMEELIGSHGGMGGEQTDSFLLHPNDMPVPATSNSADLFGILNARRGTPASQIAPKTKTVEAHVDAWTPSTLIKGLGQGQVWIGRALRTLVLDRNAYQEVARDAYMTGPALLIGLIGLALSAIVLNGAAVGSAGNATAIIARLVAWPLIALFLMVTARVLGGKASYTSTFRVTGFAYFGYWLTLLSVIPVVGPLFRTIGFLLAFLGVWLGVAQAHELRGWRTLVLPVVFLIVVIVAGVVLRALFLGAAITVDALMQDVGL